MDTISWIIDFHDYAMKHYSDPRADSYFLMSSFWNVLTIVAVYIYFVIFLGPKLMEKRKPFNLKSILIIYNLLQVICCACLFITCVIYIIPHMNIFCTPFDFSQSFHSNLTSKLSHYFFILKFVDLLDTVFFVLKKNNRQITFLHVYHHLMILNFAWLGTKFFPGGNSAFMGIINCFVHTLMYAYYLFCVIYGTSKVGWFKKQVTRVQIVQFCCNIILFGAPLLQSNCDFPKWVSYMGLVQNIYMLYAFGNFYYDNYVKPERKKLVKEH